MGVCTVRRKNLAETRGDGMAMLAVLAGVKDLLQNWSGIGVDGCSKVAGGVWWSKMVRNMVCGTQACHNYILLPRLMLRSAPDTSVGEGLDSVGEGLARETGYTAAFFSFHGVMGVKASKEKDQPPYAFLPDNRYRVLYEVDPEVISFDPKLSYAICIGIDWQKGMPEQSLGPLVVSDCKSLAEACTKYLRIPRDRVKQLVASEDPSCLFTKAGLSTLLVDCARSARVGKEGILVITFSGHGTTVVKDGTEQAVLPLIDHTMERPEYLDGKDISQCVQTTAKFCGKTVLLVLDCCFSGGIAEWLQCNEGGAVFRTIAACLAHQTSFQLNPLEHSVFTYFLLDALRQRRGISEPGEEQQEEMSDSKVHLQLHDIFTHIRDSSWALSALYVKYNKATHSLQGFTMVPVVTSKLQQTTSEEDMLDAVEMTDGPYVGSDEQGKLHFLQKQWKSFSKVPERRLPQNSYKWLRDQAKPNGPLATLHEQGHLVGRVLQATICALSNSVASIHLYEKNPWNGRARLFIIDMTEIISVVESASGSELVTVGHKAVREALTHYFAAYKNGACPNLKELKSLYRLLFAEELQIAHEGESTDGLTTDAYEDVDAAAAMLNKWQPLVFHGNQD